METYANEIIRASSELGIRAEQLSAGLASALRDRLIEKHCTVQNPTVIWENLRADVYVQDPTSWRWIESLPVSGPIVLLFDSDDEDTMFRFETCKGLAQTIGECFSFVFYLTNECADFIVSFNDHDFLLATGTMMSWLKEQRRAHS